MDKEQAIYAYWNKTKGVQHHKELKHDIRIAIRQALVNFSVADILGAISIYGTVISDDKYYWSKKWPLGIFLTRKVDNCRDSPKQFWRFLENNFVAEDYLCNTADGEVESPCNMEAIDKYLSDLGF